MTLFELMAKLTLDSKDYEDKLDDAQKKAQGFGGKLKTAIGTATKIGVAGFAALTGAASGAVVELTKSVSAAAQYGDNIDKMSQKMGLSAQAYQEWDAIMQHSGTSIESLQAGMKTLANAVENNNAAFGRLGITQDQIASMNQEQLFSATITALQGVSDETERTYLAGQLLGRGATELGALLNTSAEDTEAMRQRVHELGGVMSDEAVKAAATFQDNLQDLKTGIDGIKRSFTTSLLPGFNDVIAGFTSLIIGEEGAEDKLTGGIRNITEKFSTLLPRIKNVLSGIGKAVIQALPDVLSAGVEIVKTVIAGIVDDTQPIIDMAMQLIEVFVGAIGSPNGLSGLLDAGLVIIMQFADALITNLPTLIPAVINVVMSIVKELTNPRSLNMVIKAGIDIILAVVDGISAALPDILAAAPEIIVNLVLGIGSALGQLGPAALEIVEAIIQGIVGAFDKLFTNGEEIVKKVGEGIKRAISQAATWGKDLIESFVGGITKRWERLKQSVSNIAGFFKGIFGHSHPTIGPMKDDYKWMPDMIDLFAKGIRDNEHKLHEAAKSAFDLSDYTMTVNASQTAGYNTGVTGNSEIVSLLRQMVSNNERVAVLTPDGSFVGWMDRRLGERATARRYV